MRGGAFLKGKEGRVGFRKNSLWLKGDGGIRKTPSLTVRNLISKAIPKLTAYPHFSYFIPGYITNTAYQAYCKQLHLSVYFTLLFNLLDKYQIKVH